jgi:hypothetical protein
MAPSAARQLCRLTSATRIKSPHTGYVFTLCIIPVSSHPLDTLRKSINTPPLIPNRVTPTRLRLPAHACLSATIPADDPAPNRDSLMGPVQDALTLAEHT